MASQEAFVWRFVPPVYQRLSGVRLQSPQRLQKQPILAEIRIVFKKSFAQCIKRKRGWCWGICRRHFKPLEIAKAIGEAPIPANIGRDRQ